MLTGSELYRGLAKFQDLSQEVAVLKADLARANEYIEYLKARYDNADKRADNYFKLAEARLEWAVKLQDKINALRGRISDLADQEGGVISA